jgi:hypothetical protein
VVVKFRDHKGASSIEEAAEFLCRADSLDDVARMRRAGPQAKASIMKGYDPDGLTFYGWLYRLLVSNRLQARAHLSKSDRRRGRGCFSRRWLTLPIRPSFH